MDDAITKAIHDTNPPRPDAVNDEGLDCMNYEACIGITDTICDDIWDKWNWSCQYEWTDECSEVYYLEDAMYDEYYGNELLATASRSAQEGSSSSTSFGRDFGKGAAIGALAAFATIYVASKCSGSKNAAGNGDFERA